MVLVEKSKAGRLQCHGLSAIGFGSNIALKLNPDLGGVRSHMG